MAPVVPRWTGSPVPLVTSGALTRRAFVNSSTTKTDLAQNGGGQSGRAHRANHARLAPASQPAVQHDHLSGFGRRFLLSRVCRSRCGSASTAGLLFGLAYTFAKSIDDQSVDPVGASSGGGLSTTNSRTPADISQLAQRARRSPISTARTSLTMTRRVRTALRQRQSDSRHAPTVREPAHRAAGPSTASSPA